MHDDLRQKARDCLARARALLDAGDEPSVRYACLELRFGIEYVTYDNLVAYLDEVGAAALKKWTPKQIIDALLEVDPNADKSVGLAVGLGDAPSLESEVQSLGEDRRFSLKWANASHNALGNFLHAPTLQQIEAAKVSSVAAMAKKATEVAEELTAVLASPVSRVNFGHFFELTCECGASIKGRAGTFETKGLACRTASCGATYDVVDQSEEPRQPGGRGPGRRSVREWEVRLTSQDCLSYGLSLGHDLPVRIQQTPHRRLRMHIHAKVPHSSLPSGRAALPARPVK